MSRLPRDGTTETVSRDQILRHEREQGNIRFPIQLNTNRIVNLTRLILSVAICDDHTYIDPYSASLNDVVLWLYQNQFYLVLRSCCVAGLSLQRLPHLETARYSNRSTATYKAPVGCI